MHRWQRFGWIAIVGAVSCIGIHTPRRPAPISGPPVTGLSFIRTIGSRGTERGSFTAPRGICTDLTGNVYVADTGNDRIQKFSSDGTYLQQAGGFGFGSGQFNKPGDLIINNDLEVWVADTRNSRLHQYDSELHFIASFSPKDEEGNEVLGLPHGVAVSISGDIIVGDRDTGHMYIFNSFGTRSVRFGGFGYGAGSVDDPAALAVGPEGFLYVCDPVGGRITIYDQFGNYCYSIGDDILVAPEGIAVDHTGTIYVADTGGDKVVVFTASGAVCTTLGASGSGVASFCHPADIAVGVQGRIYVADTGNHRIQVFKVQRKRHAQ